jgi:hypothetical protein
LDPDLTMLVPNVPVLVVEGRLDVDGEVALEEELLIIYSQRIIRGKKEAKSVEYFIICIKKR